MQVHDANEMNVSTLIWPISKRSRPSLALFIFSSRFSSSFFPFFPSPEQRPPANDIASLT